MHVRPASDKALPSPSEHQRTILAFIRSGVGHGVVRATAGSGKTTTLVQVAHALPEDLRVCFLAFARDAATELKTRLPKGVGAHTVHSVGLRTLRSYLKGREVELGKVNSRKYRDLIKRELGEVKLGFGVSDKVLKPCEDYLRDLVLYARLNLTDTKDPSEVRALAVRYNLRPPGDTSLEDELHARLRTVLRDGVRLALRGDIDYPDMIYVPHILNLPPPQYEFVCVDEAQDYSALALEFTMRLVGDGGRLLFVGDPRQSIFGFAGADTDALDRIVRRSHATVLPLSVTYRCPRAHVALAQHVAPEIQAAPGATEGRVFVIRDDQLVRWVREGDMVLCRTNAYLVDTCLRLVRAGKRARVLGRDLAARLMTLVRSLFVKRSFVTYDEDLRLHYRLDADRIRKRHEGQKNLEVLLAQLRDEVDCLRYLIEDAAKDGPLSVERLEERTERTFGERDGEPSVVLSSVHRAKGKEADRVLILYPELMPASYARTPEAVRGEACVQFVALTRAKRDLVFVQAPPREREAWDGP